jgi:coniferyl-aldehyde dehydrogenase
MLAADAPAALSDLAAAFERQRAAFAAAPYPDWPLRRDRLQRLRALLIEHELEIAQAIDADFGGRPGIETELAEQFPSLEEIKSALKHGPGWMRPQRVGVSRWFLPASGEVIPQPLGVVGIIVPWNYPLFLAIGPLVGALVAGNRALIKLSEFTPRFGELFATLVARRFDADEVAVVNGGADVAAAFSSLPFDHLLFTGSTAVGRKVMAAAAGNLTPVTLELGGKSPAVIAPGARLEHAVERILVGKLLNAGQTCIAPDYVLLPRAAVDRFVELARAASARMYPQGLADANYCSVVNPRQYGRLAGYLAQAREAGVREVPLFDGTALDDARHRLAPVLLIDPPARIDAMNEEIFGPLLPLVPVDSAAQAIEFINARPRPLALYWFDDDEAGIDRALRSTHAGGVTVNDTILHVAQHSLPFGGIGPSGIGQYHGRWGFETFSKMKPVFRQSRLNGMKLFSPPYSSFARRMLALMKRG